MLSWKRLRRSDWVVATVCWVIHLYTRLVYGTGRWSVIGWDYPARLLAEKRSFVVTFWHGRLLMMPMVWKRAGPLHMLISAHPDGRIIAGAVSYFGIDWVKGSSSDGGLAALRQMVKLLRGGACVGITPDGPHGPYMRASEGAVAVARLARVPIIPLTYATARRRILRTWDRFHLPIPPTPGIFIWGEPIEVPADADKAALEVIRLLVETRMNAITAEADRRMGNEAVSVEPVDAAEPATGDAGAGGGGR